MLMRIPLWTGCSLSLLNNVYIITVLNMWFTNQIVSINIIMWFILLNRNVVQLSTQVSWRERLYTGRISDKWRSSFLPRMWWSPAIVQGKCLANSTTLAHASEWYSHLWWVSQRFWVLPQNGATKSEFLMFWFFIFSR